MGSIIEGTVLVAGEAEGPVLASGEPLSFWGGYDQWTSEIIDRRHPLSGQLAAGCILAVSASRGSSTTTAVLLEAVRSGKAPVAIITKNPDTFLTLASIVADELYGKPIPVIAAEEGFVMLQSGQHARVDAEGRIAIDD